MSYGGGIALAAAVDTPAGAFNGYYGVAPEFAAVLFHPDDKLGLVCAFLSLVPPLILAMHFSAFLARRTAGDLWFAAGQVVCEVLNVVIKLTIKQPRPLSPVKNMPADTFGMPSAHSQFMGYIAGYVVSQMIAGKHIPLYERIIRGAFITSLALGVGYSRYHLYYHSVEQVVVGLLVGATLGVSWYRLKLFLRKQGFFTWVLDLWPCRALCVKDVTYDVRQEWIDWRANSKQKND